MSLKCERWDVVSHVNSGDRVFQKEGTANTKKRHKNKVYPGTEKRCVG